MKKYLLMFCSMFAVAIARAVSVDSYGTFDIYHYDAGEVQSGLTNVQAWSAAQLEDIHAAIDEWDRVILNAPARQIKLHVGWLAFDGDLLGVSASYTTNKNTQTLWTGSELAWREGDAAETDWDAYILLDVDAAGNQWNFGAGAPTASTYDFRSVITHEIGHSLGWITSYSSALDEFGQVSGGGLTAYDRFLVDANGNRPVNGGAGTPGDFNELGAPVYFDGFNATNYYGGLVPIYAPDPYAEDSNLVHLNHPSFSSDVMTPLIGLGDNQRTVSGLEIAMMADLGWDVIPEPASLVIMLASAAGFFSVRRIFRV